MRIGSCVARGLGVAGIAALAALGAGPASADPPGEVEIEGVVSELSGECPSLRFSIAGTRIATNERTRFDDGSCSDLAEGRTVDVEATRQSDGLLLAHEVDLE